MSTAPAIRRLGRGALAALVGLTGLATAAHAAPPAGRIVSRVVAAPGPVWSHDVAHDGTYVYATENKRTPADTDVQQRDVYLVRNGRTKLVTGGDTCEHDQPSIAAGGTYVLASAYSCDTSAEAGLWLHNAVTGAKARITSTSGYSLRGYDVDATGRYVVWSGLAGGSGEYDVALLDRAANSRRTLTSQQVLSGGYVDPVISADGSTVAWTLDRTGFQGPADVRDAWVWTNATNQAKRIRPNDGADDTVVHELSANGRYAAYELFRASGRIDIGLYDRMTNARRAVAEGNDPLRPDISADGTYVVYSQSTQAIKIWNRLSGARQTLSARDVVAGEPRIAGNGATVFYLQGEESSDLIRVVR